jgi:hypothetical protein
MPPSTFTRAAGGALGAGGVTSSRVGGATGGTGAVCAKTDVAANRDSPMLPARAGLSKAPTEFPLIVLGPGAPVPESAAPVDAQRVFQPIALVTQSQTYRTFLTYLSFPQQSGEIMRLRQGVVDALGLEPRTR